jgi:hypothetical protein
LDVRSHAAQAAGQARSLASSASRLRASLAASSFTSNTAHSAIAEKLHIVCDAVSDLSDRFGSQLDAPWSRQLAALDEQLADCADYLAVLSAPGRPAITCPEFRTMDVLADQLLASLSAAAAVLLLIDRRPGSAAPAQASKLSDVATEYADDAQRERRAAVVYFSIATVLVVSAFGIVIAGLIQIGSLNHDGATQTSRVWPVFSAYLLASLVSLSAAAVLILLGERHTRAAQESTRLSRQFDVVETYLAPMATQARDLIRASLTPRLFSRILSDDDPTREPIWPTAEDIASSRPTRRAASSRHAAPKRRPSE